MSDMDKAILEKLRSEFLRLMVHSPYRTTQHDMWEKLLLIASKVDSFWFLYDISPILGTEASSEFRDLVDSYHQIRVLKRVITISELLPVVDKKLIYRVASLFK